jgi:hypothetical protein
VVAGVRTVTTFRMGAERPKAARAYLLLNAFRNEQ